MYVVGTAGHVDHGKSALVAALTGTNPDRWIEEQLRGMTLDLGFAHLPLDGGLEAGIVDVPGHERFLHNMLAGACGMDVLLVVVAANEGVMPQTLEHLQIMSYLNARRAILVLTKIDLVPSEQRDEAERDVREALKGTIAESAPAARVSSLTGEGLNALRELLKTTLEGLPAQDAAAPAYLPVDRVFSLAGAGTIVTGTLMQGRIATGDTLRLQPSGESVRVRGIHVFGKPRACVDAGSRVALNLPGVDRHAHARGDVVAGGELGARSSFAVRFTPLAQALGTLRRRTPVRAYVGSAEVLGTLVFERVPERVEEVRAELHLRAETVAFPGLRFVVRRPSPKTLLGGGFVETAEAATASESLSPAEAAAAASLRASGLQPLDAPAVASNANLRESVAADALESLAERGEALRVRRPPAFIDARAAGTLFDDAIAKLEEAHRSEPWAMGATSIALARGLQIEEPLLVRLLAVAVDEGRIVQRSGYYATLEFRPELTAEQSALFERLVPVDARQPFLPSSFDEVAAQTKRSGLPGATKAMDTLLLRGVLVKVGDAIYRGSQIAKIVARVEEHLRRNEKMTAAEFRDLLATSRKYAVPLLEWLDARGVTIRSGDHRTLRKKAP